jgi:hypothetical protein
MRDLYDLRGVDMGIKFRYLCILPDEMTLGPLSYLPAIGNGCTHARKVIADLGG